MASSLSFGSPFVNDSVCKTIKNKSIFNIPLLNELNRGDRYVFTSHNDSRFVQLETTTEMLRWSSVLDQDFGSMHLKMLKIKADIIDIVLSDGGRFIAFYTKDDIHMIEIPWAYKDVSNMNHVFQRKVSKVNNVSKIKKVLFHPKAANDSCVVILFEDDSIWLYDFNIRKKIILNEENGRFGLGDKVTLINDMVFSNDGLTLYLLSVSGGGDIHALYPCLPSRLLITESELQTLMSKSVILYNSINKETKPEVKRSIIKQVQFVTKLGLKNKEKDDEVGLEIEDNYRYVKPQGPFTIAPFPGKLYASTAKQITVLDIGRQNELLVMTFDDKNVLFLFKDLELSMVWDTPGFYYNTSLVLIENLKLTSSGEEIVIKSFKKQGKFLLKDIDTVYLVDTTTWSSLVSKCISDEDLTPLVGTSFKSNIVTLDWKDKFCSAGVWKYNGVEGLIVSSPLKVYTKSFFVGTSLFSSIKNNDEAKIKEREDEIKYTVAFSQPISEIMELTKLYRNDCRNPFPDIIEARIREKPIANDSNEEQLSIMTKFSSDLITKIIKGQSLGINLHSRILEQQYELTRQLKHTQDIVTKQETMDEVNKGHIYQWNEKVIKQINLIKRFNDLNEILTQIETSEKFKDIVISNNEITWFKEIRNQAVKFNEFVHKQKAVNDDLKFIAKELTVIQSRSGELQTKAKNEWESLRQILKEDSVLIKQSFNVKGEK